MRSPKGAEQCICEISFPHFQLCPNSLIFIILNFSSSLESVCHPLPPNNLAALDSAVLRAEVLSSPYKTPFSEQQLQT